MTPSVAPSIMIGLIWNYRGMGQAVAVRHLRRLISTHRPSVVFLSKNKLSDDIAMVNLVNLLSFDCFENVPTRGHVRGLVLMWHDDINVQISLSNDNCINCLILEDSHLPTW